MPLRWRNALAALLLVAPLQAQAAIPKGMALPACGDRFAREFRVDTRLVQSIRIAEGGRVGQSVCGNKNRTCDHGPMQINDGWLDGRWGISLPRDYGISKKAVLHNECQNIRVGIWVLRQAYNRTGDWYQAVAAYNAGLGNRKAGYPYANRVFRWYERISGLQVLKPRKTSSAPVPASAERAVPIEFAQAARKPELRRLTHITERSEQAP